MHLSLKRRIYREKFYIIAFMDYITSTKYFKTVTKIQVDEMFDILDDSLNEVQNKLKNEKT